MLRILTLPLLSALPSLAGPGASTQEQETDSVFLRDGNTEMGKVLEEGFAGLSFQPERGPKKTVPWSDVRSVDYFDAPEELSGGLATLAAGNAQSALEQFQLVLAGQGLRPVIIQQALFHAAIAESRLGQVDEAAKRFQELLGEFPKSRYLRQVGESLINLMLDKGDVAGAQAALAKMAQEAKGVDGIDALFGLLAAKLLERESKIAEARERFAAVEAMPGADPELLQEAKLGRARTLLAESKTAEADSILRALITDSKSSRVQSGAWNGIGEIQAKEGRAKKEADRIQEGLYAYLRTVVQYKPLPGESTEEFERALFGASTCFQYLSELEQSADKKKLNRERQRERVEQLQREYPRSIFLKKK